VAVTSRLRELLQRPGLLLGVYLLLAVVASVQQWLLSRSFDPSDPYTHYNNYVIYRQSFAHLAGGQELYTLYLDEHWDYFRYSPSFALAFAAFAWMPDLPGLMLWNAVNVMVLFAAWRALPLGDGRVAMAAGWFVVIELLTALQNSQSNALIAGLLILAFALLERRQVAGATLMIAIASFTKLFGLAAFSLCLLYPEKRKFAAWSAAWVVGLALLPLAVVPPGQLLRLYESWWRLLAADYSQSAGLSVMAWLQSWFHATPPNRVVGIVGLGLLVWPLAYGRRYGDAAFRLLFLCSLLVWVVIFNHKAESSSYVIAMGGVGLWYFSQQPTRLKTALASLAFVFTSLSPTDIFPRPLSAILFVPYTIKAVPCILVWARITYELVTGRYQAAVGPAPGALSDADARVWPASR
jgi:hypothetical protein